MNSRLLLTASFLALLAPVSHAQRFDYGSGRRGGLQTTEQGEGTVTLRSGQRGVDEATVILEPDGRARVLLEGQRSYSFDGQWDKGKKESYAISIDRAMDRHRATGSGIIYFLNGELSSVRFTGDCEALGGAYGVSFSSEGYRDGGGHGDTRFSLSATRRGYGAMEIDGDDFDLSQASVALDRTGEARVTLSAGRRSYDLTGTWRSRGRDSVELIIDRFGRSSARASGTVWLSGSTFSKLALDGDSRSLGAFRADFDASDRRADDRGGYPPSRFGGLRETITGRGSFGTKDPIPLIECSLDLQRNGLARIDFRGRRSSYSLDGSWAQGKDPNLIAVSVTRLGSFDASGSGRIYLTRGRVSSVKLDGKSSDIGKFFFSFTAE